MAILVLLLLCGDVTKVDELDARDMWARVYYVCLKCVLMYSFLVQRLLFSNLSCDTSHMTSF